VNVFGSYKTKGSKQDSQTSAKVTYD